MRHRLRFPPGHRSDGPHAALIIHFSRQREIACRLCAMSATMSAPVWVLAPSTSNPIEPLRSKTYFMGEELNDTTESWLSLRCTCTSCSRETEPGPWNITVRACHRRCVFRWGTAKAKPQPKMPNRQEVADLHISRHCAARSSDMKDTLANGNVEACFLCRIVIVNPVRNQIRIKQEAGEGSGSEWKDLLSSSRAFRTRSYHDTPSRLSCFLVHKHRKAINFELWIFDICAKSWSEAFLTSTSPSASNAGSAAPSTPFVRHGVLVGALWRGFDGDHVISMIADSPTKAEKLPPCHQPLCWCRTGLSVKVPIASRVVAKKFHFVKRPNFSTGSLGPSGPFGRPMECWDAAMGNLCLGLLLVHGI